MQGFRWVHTPEPPPRVPGYTILESLGTGGQGSVYRARHELLGREVALKTTLRDGLDARSEARFAREAALLARFAHPGVIRIHEWGQTPELLYLDCELIEGARGFGEACAELPLERQLALVAELFEVLAAVHALGVIHRDLKPENVLVTPAGRIKLVDFGIATAGGLERLTQTGGFVGTFLYAPPERLNQSANSEGPAADVWSAGALCCEVLTGRVPYPAQTVAELTGLALAPAPPLRSLRPDLPLPASRALDAALAFRPQSRPAAAEVARLLRTRTASGRGRRAWIAAAVLGVAGLGAGLALRERRTEPRPRDPAPVDPTRRHADSEALVAEFLRTGVGAEALALEVGADAAVETLARALLPPARAAAPPPPEWVRIGGRLGAGRPHLARAVERAQRGAPWDEVLEALAAGRVAEPEAPWTGLRALLARERGVFDAALWGSAETPEEPWGKLARALTEGDTQALEALARHPEEDVRRVTRAHLAFRLDLLDPAARAAAAEDAEDYGALRAVLDLQQAELTSLAQGIALLDDPELPGGGELYARVLVERVGLVLRLVLAQPPTQLRTRLAQRFLELSWERLPQSVDFKRLTLRVTVAHAPHLRRFVLEHARREAERETPAQGAFAALVTAARVQAPLPTFDAPLPPEWRARVAELEGESAARLRDAVHLSMLGHPWERVQDALDEATAAAPGDPRLPIARALLCLARQADGALNLPEVCEGLPPTWRTFVRASWEGRPLTPDTVEAIGLEAEVLQAVRGRDLPALRALSARHSLAEAVAFLETLPPSLGPEDRLRRLDPLLEQFGALNVELWARRAHAAWRWAGDRADAATAGFALRWASDLAPDGPAYCLTLLLVDPETWPRVQALAVDREGDWSQSGRGLRLIARSLALETEAERERARTLLLRAQALEPGHLPREWELQLRQELFGSRQLPR